MSVINPHIMQVFEFRNYLIIGGFTRLFGQLCAFLAALTSVLISLKFKTGIELKLPYRIVAGIGCAFSCVGFVLSFQENDDKFLFKNEVGDNENNLGVNNIRESTDDENKKEE